MYPSIFFGILFLALGLSFLLGTLFGISIPVFKILFGCFFVYLGFQMIFGFRGFGNCYSAGDYHGSDPQHATCMGKAHVVLDEAALRAGAPRYEYSTVFGGSIIDFSRLTPELAKTLGTPLMLTVSTVFGGTQLILHPDLLVRVDASAAFGKAVSPDKTSVAFGSHTYQSQAGQEPQLIVKASVVFGGLDIERHA
jgi:hypothetical protein